MENYHLYGEIGKGNNSIMYFLNYFYYFLILIALIYIYIVIKEEKKRV